MKIIAHCTNRYLPIYEQFFKASAPASFDIEFQLDDPRFSGYSFTSPHELGLAFSNYLWQNLIREVENHIGEVIVYTGVDLQFFADVAPELTELIADQDVLFLNDVGLRCPEFMTVRCSQAVADVFRDVVARFNLPDMENDSLVLTGMELPLRSILLPKSYWTIGWCTARGLPIEVPDDLKVHHGNYVVGFDDKMTILTMIREKAAAKGIKWASER